MTNKPLAVSRFAGAHARIGGEPSGNTWESFGDPSGNNWESFFLKQLRRLA